MLSQFNNGEDNMYLSFRKWQETFTVKNKQFFVIFGLSPFEKRSGQIQSQFWLGQNCKRLTYQIGRPTVARTYQKSVTVVWEIVLELIFKSGVWWTQKS